MKKVIGGMIALYICVGFVIAGMDDIEVTASDLKPATTQTNQFVVRGLLESVVLTASSTESSAISNTVVITCDSETLLSNSFTNDSIVYPRRQMHDYAGNLLVFDGVNTNKFYDKFPVAGTVTVKQTGVGPATNDWKVKLVFWK